ncbi:hypothetical protein BpHYR1_041047 [Brachionus plicatilis]|uniref:Uncharacterized protein n=1 Tax=Brachionus plicatilis TaxID=10195 RepID=A0A3M7PHE6_BRAPC|nr:hypothetical protein BpHYR1_041047 [Brachionus plicatilis]
MIAKLRAYFNHKSGRSQRKMARNRYEFIIDDESYFTLGNTALPGNNIVYSSNVCKTPDSLAISQRDISEPCFVPSGLYTFKEKIVMKY